jgi:imidazolonepropionase-like amidohydrolase
MKNQIKNTFILVICLSFFGCNLAKVGAQEMVLGNVHVVDVESGKVLEDRFLILKDGKIMQVFPMSKLPNSGVGMNITDGKGAYVFPGLAEMHAHLPAAADGNTQLQEETLWLYLSNGVLRIRSMLGHESHLALKKKVVNGELPGPRMFISGPSLNGTSVESPQMGSQLVGSQKAAGYDHLKLHPGLDTPKFLAIAETANAVGIPYGGHVSLDVGLETALQNGYKSVEHMDGYLEAMISDKAKLNPTIAGPFSMLLVKDADQEKLPALIKMTLKNKTWIAPTLTLFDRYFGYVPADSFRVAPEMKYLPGLQIQQWVSQKKLLESQGVLSKANVQPYLEFRNQLFLALHRAGVPMLMSSDSPQVFNVPGFSIHHEIEMMSNAGMSNLEILRTGSINPALYFDQKGEWGVINRGAAADFVLVEKNPLVDLSTLKRPIMVVMGGNIYDRARLDAELASIEQKHLRRLPEQN